MDTLASLLLGSVVEAIIAALISEGASEARLQLQRNDSKQTLQRAIGQALARYVASQPERKVIAQPLLRRNSLLAETEIAGELAKVVLAGEPDVSLIGRRWRDELDSPPPWRDFQNEAKLLVEYLRAEVRNMPSGQAGLTSSASEVEPTSIGHSLAEIEDLLESIIELMDSGFGRLATAVVQSSAGIRSQVRDFSFYMGEKTREFVGRQFIFEEISAFIASHERGYFLLLGDPGIGKSAIMAKLVKDNGWIHHFNIRAEGINKTSDFLANICAQLIANYGLNYSMLPPEALHDAGFLNRLLREVSEGLNPGSKCVIVVDALDEAEHGSTQAGTGVNVLCLPHTLPPGIFIIATARRETTEILRLRVDLAEQVVRQLLQDEPHNHDDIVQLLRAQMIRPDIQAYLQRQQMSSEAFLNHMAAKAQGNFMYLRYVLPEIERGAYTGLALEHLPVGLENYYEDHWRRMRQRDEFDWFAHKLPVIVALTIVEEPVSLELLADFSQVRARAVLYAVLADFDQFVYKVDIDYQGGMQRRYRWYHASFFQFIAGKDGVAGERVSIKEAYQRAEDALWEDMYGSQSERLHSAILAAFNREELRRIMRTCMDENFDHLVADKAFQDQVFELIEWASSRQRLPVLVRCLQAARPESRELATI